MLDVRPFLVMLAIFLTTCDDGDHSARGLKPLPENPQLKIAGQDLAEALIRGARDFCREMHDPIARMCAESAVPLGQLSLVQMRLERPVLQKSEWPIAVYAITGTAGTGEEYLSVTAFSLSREITAVHVLARGPDCTCVRIRVDIPAVVKSLEATWYKYFVVDRVSWDELRKQLGTPEADESVVGWTTGARVRLPTGNGVELCIAVEDRLAGMSGFIPVCQFNYPRR